MRSNLAAQEDDCYIVLRERLLQLSDIGIRPTEIRRLEFTLLTIFVLRADDDQDSLTGEQCAEVTSLYHCDEKLEGWCVMPSAAGIINIEGHVLKGSFEVEGETYQLGGSIDASLPFISASVTVRYDYLDDLEGQHPVTGALGNRVSLRSANGVVIEGHMMVPIQKQELDGSIRWFRV
ncbi:hypothetical protein PT974_11321 [Cladobotryum mycophilum]|uniref:Uncharacterized protein n=1 Tax=Cladobotryum mycophilum TaxID=491253 RepID=A0ABR0S5X3_9HYPO